MTAPLNQPKILGYNEVYMNLWRECLRQGYSSQDARDYAEHETIVLLRAQSVAMIARAGAPAKDDIQDKEPKVVPPTPIVTKPPMPKRYTPVKIKDLADALKPFGASAQIVIQPNVQTDPDLYDEEAWARMYGQS